MQRISLVVSILSGITSWKANKESAVISEKLQKLNMRQNIMPYFNLDFSYEDQSKTKITDDGFDFSLINVGNMTAVNITLITKEKTNLKINNELMGIVRNVRTKSKFAFPKDIVKIHLTKGELADKKIKLKSTLLMLWEEAIVKKYTL